LSYLLLHSVQRLIYEELYKFEKLLILRLVC